MEALLNYSDSDGGTGADDRGSEEGTSDCSSTSEAPSILDELDSNQPPTPPGNREAESKHRLLSAADLFAVQIDTVHVKPQKKEFEITPTELESNGKPAPSKQPAVIEKSAEYSAAGATAAPKQVRRSVAASDNGRAKKDPAKKRSAEDLSAKDKVKRQRLNGQAGIGSDFKEWRSEEEMRQRQMFD